jgi:hypothetical protein
MSGPLCKVCGKPVPKTTSYHEFGVEHISRSPSWVCHPEKPATREEAQRLVNGQIISIKMSWRGDSPRYVARANVWDGESYEWDGNFHAQSCAAAFGAAMALQHPTFGMPAYHAAMKERA